MRYLKTKGVTILRSFFLCLEMQKLLHVLLLSLIITSALLPRFCLCLTPENSPKNIYSVQTLKQGEICTDCGHIDICCKLDHKSPIEPVNNPISSLQKYLAFVILTFRSHLSHHSIANSIVKAHLNFFPLLAKWPCSKFYLAKQSLLI